MADRMDSLEDMLSCGVCMEEFDISGEHLPRLLPCTHTVCEACIKQLIRNKKLECQECRTKHEVRNEEKSFPQNKYLLIQIRKFHSETEGMTYEYGRCEEHKKDLILFCREEDCHKAICTTCLKTSHKKHDVTEIEDEKKDNIMKTIESFDALLQRKMSKISRTKEDIETEVELCIKELKEDKEEMCKEFDEAIEDAENKMEEVRTQMKDELHVMEETMIVLEDIKNTIENIEENKYQCLMSKMDTINGIGDTIKESLSGMRKYVYHEYISRQETKGRMVEEKHVVVELGNQSSVDIDEYDDGPQNCTVSPPVELGFEPVFLALLSDGSLAVSGQDDDEQTLKSYDLETGRKLKEVSLEFEPLAMTSLILGDTAALAFTYKGLSLIEFRGENLDEILDSHLVAPHTPGYMLTIRPSTLLYVDESKAHCDIHWLDFSTTNPTARQKVISTLHTDIWEIQHAKREGLVLVMAAPGSEGIHAYNESSGELKWNVVGKPLGMGREIWPCSMAGNDKGRLLVCDSCYDSEAIQMFSVSDGRYQGCLIRKGEKGLKEVQRVLWCGTIGCLVVIHGSGEDGCISKIEIS